MLNQTRIAPGDNMSLFLLWCIICGLGVFGFVCHSVGYDQGYDQGYRNGFEFAEAVYKPMHLGD